jgi:hypothetical protein
MREIELEERLNLFNKKALHSAPSSRPENTKKAYQPRQKEWRVSIVFFTLNYKLAIVLLLCKDHYI